MIKTRASSGREGGRSLKKRVKTARQRSLASTLWLERQLNDPYVARAKREGFRSRAAYKLLEMDERYHFLKPFARASWEDRFSGSESVRFLFSCP